MGGTPVIWWHKYKFIIEIDGVVRAAFTTCSELNIEAANVAHREGGRLQPHNAPGTVTFPEITLTRGQTDDFDLYNWFKDTFDAAAGTGLDTPDIYRTFDIIQQNRKGEAVERYTVYDAYARTYGGGDWDNNADEVRMESVTVQPDRWERVPA
jgi:phage tail-like protein